MPIQKSVIKGNRNMKRNNRLTTFLPASLGILLILFSGWQLLRHSTNSNQLASTSDSQNINNSTTQQTFSQLTTNGGFAPEFDKTGKAIYFIDMLGILNICQIDVPPTTFQELGELPLSSKIVWNDKKDRAAVEWPLTLNEGIALAVINPKKLDLTPSAEGSWGSSWTPNDEITFLTTGNFGVELWKMNREGAKPVKIASINDVLNPEIADWSPNGTRLLVQGAVGVKIFSYINEVAIEGDWIDWATEASWSPDGYLLSYRKNGAESDTLWVANLDGAEQKQVFEGVFSEVNWLPDGRLVFFTPGKEGGAACWALDPKTGNKELLADSSIVIYKPVEHIAVSPTGDMLAFQAQDGNIWLLKFEKE